MFKSRSFITLLSFALSLPILSFANSANEAETIAVTFLLIGVLLLVAKLSGLIEKLGQPSVVGELVSGIVLGNLAALGVTFFDQVKENEIIYFLSQLGVVLLLFQIGLDSSIEKMKAVGLRALAIASIGVVVSFSLTAFVVGPLFLAGASMQTYIFLGAAMTATSVGIAARVFKDMGKNKTPEAQMVIGAAIIDDVIGLIILAVVSSMFSGDGVSASAVAGILGKAVGFLVISIIIGMLIAPYIGKFLSRIHTGTGMKLTFAISFGLVFAYLAYLVGLAPIIGAFAAGLVLEPVHFKQFRRPHLAEEVEEALEERNAQEETKMAVSEIVNRHTQKHVEDLIEPLAQFTVPLFFLLTGMGVNLSVLSDWKVLLLALGITASAFIGKIASCLAAGNVRKMVVGWGMVPRGEVSLIFAAIGKSLGVVTDEIFSALVIMILLSSLVTPVVLSYLLKDKEIKAGI